MTLWTDEQRHARAMFDPGWRRRRWRRIGIALALIAFALLWLISIDAGGRWLADKGTRGGYSALVAAGALREGAR